jgi:hypothetical protein
VLEDLIELVICESVLEGTSADCVTPHLKLPEVTYITEIIQFAIGIYTIFRSKVIVPVLSTEGVIVLHDEYTNITWVTVEKFSISDSKIMRSVGTHTPKRQEIIISTG